MEKKREREALAKNDEVNEGDDSRSKKKCVSLKITDLEQSQERSETKCGAAGSADRAAVNDRAIKKSSNAGEEFLSVLDQPGVKFVEVKKAAEKIDMQRFAFAIAVNDEGAAGARD